MPADETDGPAEKSPGLVLSVISKETVWPPSFGPALIPVAQAVTVCAPASSATVWSAPLVKLGASLTPLTVIVNVCVGAGVDAAVRGAAVVAQEDRDRRRSEGVRGRSEGQHPRGRDGRLAEKRALLLFVTVKVTVCPDSFGPALIDVAQPAL